jgi:hypothetical protein
LSLPPPRVGCGAGILLMPRAGDGPEPVAKE